MASASRTLTRALRTARTPALRTTARVAAPQPFRQYQQRRGYASEPESQPDKYEGNPRGMLWGASALLAVATGYGVYMTKPEWFGKESSATAIFTPKFEDYQKVYDHVAKLLEEKDDYDDGSYGPVLLRLAWHASGTYVASTLSQSKKLEILTPIQLRQANQHRWLQRINNALRP
jgi:cytochrome c peroxidase